MHVDIKDALFEDLVDLNSFEERKDEAPICFEEFVTELKPNGNI
jgi:hypothetical protein